MLFFFNDPATTEIYTLSLHDALPISFWVMGFNYEVGPDNMVHSYSHRVESQCALAFGDGVWDPKTRRDPWNVFTCLELDRKSTRLNSSHQIISYAVFCLKKKTKTGYG